MNKKRVLIKICRIPDTFSSFFPELFNGDCQKCQIQNSQSKIVVLNQKKINVSSHYVQRATIGDIAVVKSNRHVPLDTVSNLCLFLKFDLKKSKKIINNTFRAKT
ncbi:hypothetical protein BpHYR1_013060 [Brachionus plicatilis]|uniref:Uncharacterized protein n=1 Tax=Brachionus plicatilis TaxID=10195 RepID=A0A3M7RU61_BRAPC|nr:hypothetical protein BpHYR1_013060 [Brachionus plicatilis]